MDIVYGVFSFLVILEEAFKLVPKNGKLFALIALLSVLLSVITYVASDLSILGLAQSQDLLSGVKSSVPRPISFNTSDPSSFSPSLSTPSLLEHLQCISKMENSSTIEHEMVFSASSFPISKTVIIQQLNITIHLKYKNGVCTKLQHHEFDYMQQAITFAVEIAFKLILLIIFYFSTIATILIAEVSYTGNTLSIKNFFLTVARTWTITSIYISIYSLGILPILVIFAVPVFIYPNIVTVLITTFLAIVVFLLYLYLVVIWVLAIVVSVIEDGCYGMAAMGKASDLVKGQRLKGCMLTLFFILLNLIIALVNLKISGYYKIPSDSLVYGCFSKY